MDKNKKLKFYEKSHTYKVGKTKLKSVTRFIHEFFEPFDAKAVARKLAKFPVNKQNKRGVRYWLGKWKQDSEHGTTVHKALEDWIRNASPDEIDVLSNRDINKFSEGAAFIDENLRNSGELQPEVKVFNEKYRLAGTVDLLLMGEDGKLHLYDWKTNKAIREKSYNKNDKGFEPVPDLDNCNYNHYALQLSVYARMLELEGYEIGTLNLVHLREDSVKTYSIVYDDYKGYVEKILEERLKQIKEEDENDEKDRPNKKGKRTTKSSNKRDGKKSTKKKT